MCLVRVTKPSGKLKSFILSDMIKAFPNAKVILTVRDPDTWYKSVSQTIYKGNKKTKDIAMRIFMQIAGKTNLIEVIDRTAWEPAEGTTEGSKHSIYH